MEAWIKNITDYCEQEGIAPDDLIDFHRKGRKAGKIAANDLKIENSSSPAGIKTIPGLSIQAQIIRDKKIGLKKAGTKKGRLGCFT